MPVSVPIRTLPFMGDSLRLCRDEKGRTADALDDARFAAMVERHAGLLYRIAYSLLRNRQDAEDAVQDCLLKLHRSGAWRGMQEERAFLARSCWRAALDRLPRGGRVYVEADDKTVPGHENTPESQVLQGADSARLHTLIDALPLKLRETLLLSGFNELNSREIAVDAKELDGKRLINTREYKTYVTMQGRERGFAQIRSGSRIPITTGSNTDKGTVQSMVSYIDIGINIDVANARMIGGKLVTKVVAEISSVDDSANKADPVISQRKWEGSVILAPDKVIPIFSSDDVESKHTFQLDVVAREMP